MWDGIFGAGNLLAMLCWIALILLPRRPLVLSAVLYLGCALLCLAYAGLLVAIMAGLADPHPVAGAGPGGVSFSTIAGVRAIFMSDGGVTVGWLHYLAFDLFTGLWIARDGDAKEIARLVQAPVLLLTFFAGPAGLLVWLVLREGAARRTGWQRKKIKL